MAKTVGQIIKKLRLKGKMSQRELAQAADISQPYLLRIERDRQEPSLDVLRRIAAGLGVNYKELLP